MTYSNSNESGEGLRPEYTNEEVSEIIRVALLKAEGADQSKVSRDELLSIAKEFDLTLVDLVRASEELDEVDDVAARREKVWHDFKLNLSGYGVGVLGLFAMNLATYASADQWWFQFPAIAYGAVVLGHFVMAKFNPELAYTMLRGDEEESSSENHSGMSSAAGAKD